MLLGGQDELAGRVAGRDRGRVLFDRTQGFCTGRAGPVDDGYDFVACRRRADDETGRPRPTASPTDDLEQVQPPLPARGRRTRLRHNRQLLSQRRPRRPRRTARCATAAAGCRSGRSLSDACAGRRPAPGAVAGPADTTFANRLPQCRHRHSDRDGRDTRRRRLRVAASTHARARTFPGPLRARRRARLPALRRDRDQGRLVDDGAADGEVRAPVRAGRGPADFAAGGRSCVIASTLPVDSAVCSSSCHCLRSSDDYSGAGITMERAWCGLLSL